MKGRDGKGATSTDLLVCFPSRAHLTLMPKPICSPARPSEPNNRAHSLNHHHHHHHQLQHHLSLRKSLKRGCSGPGSLSSPMLWSKNKAQMGGDMLEPTSPKVTCAGQIKVRPSRPGPCKSWQSMMEEIERLHNNENQKKKRPTWVESLGFKKEVMQFLTCLRSLRFDFRCFGNFPTSDIISDEEDEVNYPEKQVGRENCEEDSRTVFSKWFMVLQENQNGMISKEQSKEKDRPCYVEETESSVNEAPPANALLLMRCRSAPAKPFVEEREEEDDEEEEEDEDREKEEEKKAMEEEQRMKKQSMVVMRYDSDFYKISSDIAKETWVVGGIRDSLSRNRSWKR